MPDTGYFGFTPQTLRHLHVEVWGEKGRQTYVKAATVDLLVLMEAYTVLLWIISGYLTTQCPREWRNFARLLACLPIGFDFVETTVLQQACLRPIKAYWIRLGSIANQTKWLSILFFWLVHGLLWYLSRHSSFRKKASKKE